MKGAALFDGLLAQWKVIPVGLARRQVELMPDRLEAVIGAIGGHTKY